LTMPTAIVTASRRRTMRRSTPTAAVASHLSAARLTRWRCSGNAIDAARALNDSSRALTLDPTPVAAQFNRALALEAIGLIHKRGVSGGRMDDRLPSTPMLSDTSDVGSSDSSIVAATVETRIGVRYRGVIAEAPDRGFEVRS